MAKPRTPNQKKRYAALNKRLAKYVSLVQSIYDSLVLDAANIVTTLTDYSPDTEQPFRFKDYPLTKSRVDDLMRYFSRDLQALIYSGTTEEWKQSNLVQDLLANDVLKIYGMRRDGEKVKLYYQPNNDALRAFQQRKDKGFTVSQKVWNQSYNFKRELEYAISSGIERGQSAVNLSKRISKYLHDFPSLQDDYGERYGHAVDCQNCEYRSIRLARSEINMAYRTAEQTRWQQMDFIKGYEIKLSHSHPKTDICDQLAGVYPKWFHWTGWHPNCYSDDSEVLTSRGWRLFKDVCNDDLILSLNTNTRNIEWVGIIAAQCHKYQGEMIHFFNKSLDCLVTPEHQMVYLNKSDGRIKKCLASEYRMGLGGFYRGCNYDAPDIESININGNVFEFDAFCEFMAYYLSDGSTQRNYGVCISQKDGQPYKPMIADSIRRLGYKPTDDGKRLCFYDTKFSRYLKQFGTAYSKFVPDEIKQSSKRQIQIFLNAYTRCDGHTRKRNEARFIGSHGNHFVQKREERIYFTTSDLMVRDLSELILKAGNRPSYGYTEPCTSHTSDGRIIKSNFPCWRINECYSTTATVFEKELIPYDGYVYDLTLERNHIMYIRRKGKCFWGSNCMCYVIPIVMTDDEWYSGNGGEITELPDNCKEWIGQNQDRIDAAKQRDTLPYWIKDNEKAISDMEPLTYKSVAYSHSEVMTPKEIEDLTIVDEMLKDVLNDNPEYFHFGYGGIKAVSRDKTYMSTAPEKGVIEINFAENQQGFNPGKDLVSAFNKIKKGEVLLRNEEYAVETLWHEIYHNMSANTFKLPDWDDLDGFSRVTMETVNQLCARHTYPVFLQQLGGTARHYNWILEDGYGYNALVKNLRRVLKYGKIDEAYFVSDASALLLSSYKDIDIKIENLLLGLYQGRGDISFAFKSIERDNIENLLNSLAQ